jgi:hypothetical protein
VGEHLPLALAELLDHPRRRGALRCCPSWEYAAGPGSSRSP